MRQLCVASGGSTPPAPAEGNLSRGRWRALSCSGWGGHGRPPPTHTEPWPPNHLGCPGTEKKEKKCTFPHRKVVSSGDER